MKGNTILQILTLVVCVYVTYFTYHSFKEIGQLRAENELILCKLDSLQNIAPVTADKPAGKTPRPVCTGTNRQNISKEPSNSAAKEIADKPAKKVSQSQSRKPMNEVKKTSVKIRVSASYRIEDRYVLGDITLPDTVGTEPGKVTINILIDHVGSVKKTSIASADGITDENVLDACRKAALKTHFNINTDAPKAQPGAITYTFAAQ